MVLGNWWKWLAKKDAKRAQVLNWAYVVSMAESQVLLNFAIVSD
jgi:hypothetical protein